MIKSVVSGLVALSVLATPVAAEARGRDDYYRGERHEHGISTGGAIAIGLGALILGAAASNRSRYDYDRPYDRGYDRPYNRNYDYDYRVRRSYCREVISSGYDSNGDYYEKRTVRC